MGGARGNGVDAGAEVKAGRGERVKGAMDCRSARWYDNEGEGKGEEQRWSTHSEGAWYWDLR